MDALIEEIIKIDENEELCQEMFNQPLFENGEIPDFAKPENVLKFIERVL